MKCIENIFSIVNYCEFGPKNICIFLSECPINFDVLCNESWHGKETRELLEPIYIAVRPRRGCKLARPKKHISFHCFAATSKIYFCIETNIRPRLRLKPKGQMNHSLYNQYHRRMFWSDNIIKYKTTF
jgi:hypothetical protein